MAEKKIIEIEVKTQQAVQSMDALSKSTKEAGKEFDKAATFAERYGEELQPLTTRMGEAEDRLYELANAGQTTTQEYKDLLKTVGEFRKVQINTDMAVDAAATTMGQKLGGALGGVTAGFSLAQGAFAAFGGESEEIEKALLKVQAAMAIQQGVQGIREAIPSFKALGAVIKSTAVFQGIYNFVQTGSAKATTEATVAKVADAEATVAQGTATVATTTATTGASAALKLLRVALISTGIGALIVGVGLLIANFEAIKAPLKGVIQGLKDFGDWLGITDNKSKDNADKARIRSEATMNQIKKEADLRNRIFENQQRKFTDEDTAIGRQIALMKAQNKDTTDLERARLKASIAYQTSIVRETYSIEQQLKQKNILTVAELRAAAERTGNYAAWNKFEKEMAEQRSANTKINLAAYDAMEQAQNDLKIFEQELLNDATKNVKESIKRKAEKEKEGKEKEKEAIKKHNDNLTAFYDSIESERQAKITNDKEKEQQELANKYEKLYELADKAGKSTKDLQEQQGKDSQAITKKYDDLAKVEKDKKDKLEKERLATEKTVLQELTKNEAELKLIKLDEEYKAQQLLYKDNKEILKALDEKYAKDKENLENEELARKRETTKKGIDMAMSALSILNDAFQMSAGKSEKDQRKAFKAQKAFNLASAITNTYLAVASALALNPKDSLFPGQRFVEAGLAGAAGAVQIANIAKTKFEGGASADTSGGGGGGVTAPTMSAPQFNVVGQSGVNQLASLNQQPIQAYVVSGQVTSQQALDRNRLENATLGG
jgi:hypothetical protein